MGSVQVSAPQGKYAVAKRHNDLVFTAGMTPRKDGKLVAFGPVSEKNLEAFRGAVVLACDNALEAARSILDEGEKISSIISLTVFIAGETGFEAHSKVADFASQHLDEKMGDMGIGARAAVGVASLPGNAPVEIQIVAAVRAGTLSGVSQAACLVPVFGGAD